MSVYVTAEMKRFRDSLLDAVPAGMTDTLTPEMMEALGDRWQGITSTMGLDPEQVGWALMAAGQLVGQFGIGVLEDEGGFSDEGTRLAMSLLGMVEVMFAMVGSRLITDAELPPLLVEGEQEDSNAVPDSLRPYLQKVYEDPQNAANILKDEVQQVLRRLQGE